LHAFLGQPVELTDYRNTYSLTGAFFFQITDKANVWNAVLLPRRG